MEILQNAEAVPTSDLFYDIIDGGYFDPNKFLANKEDIKRVNEALSTINEYIALLNDNDLIEWL